MTPYVETETHGTPAGYKAGCKTDAMCDPIAPWSCRRSMEKYRGDYSYHRRVDQGLSPDEIQVLEQQEAETPPVPAVKPKPKKSSKRYGSRLPLSDPTAGPSTHVAPDRLAAYGANVSAAKQRIASAPTPDPMPAAALAASTPSKENPMSNIPLPAGVQWKTPPPAALAASGPRSKNQLIIAAAKSQPRQWLCLGPASASAATRWRKGDVTGTKPREFEAVVDNGEGRGAKGDLYVRYVGTAAAGGAK